MENLNESRVKELRSDNGTEFRNHKLEEFCDEKGISQNFSSPCTLEQNGVAERRNITLIEAAKTMLNSAKLAKQFLGKAYSTEGDTINFNENKSFPDDEFLEPRSEVTQCLSNTEYFPYILAYENTIPSELPILQVSIISEDPSVFSEADDHPALNELDQTESANHFELVEPQNNVIITNQWSRDKHIELVNIIGEPLASITTRSKIRDSDAASASECLYVNFLFEIEPKKLIEALEEEGWIIAMQEELNQFKRNKEWIDYEETFAPVARLKAIRIFLAYAAYMGFMVYQMDVNSAFLNGKILKEVYVQQTPGFESSEYPNHVCPDKLGVSINETLFRGMIRSLMYLIGSRLDIQFSTCLCARHHILKGDIELHFVPIDLQLADIFIKSLAEPSFTRLVAELGMLNIEKQDKPLSFTQDEFISTISLPIYKDTIPPPPKEIRIPPSSKPKSLHKVRVILLKKKVAETQHADVIVATVDATKSLVASKLAEEQRNQPSATEAEMVIVFQVKGTASNRSQTSLGESGEVKGYPRPNRESKSLLDEDDKLNKTVQETPENPYDTKSEIKVVKSFLTNHVSKLHDISDFDLQSMPDDDLRSVSGFEVADSDDNHENKVSKSNHIFQDDNASTERLSLPDHMDHICEEVSSLQSKLGDMESSIVHQIFAEIGSSLPALVTTTLKEQIPGLLSDALKDTLPQLIKDSIKIIVFESITEELPQPEEQQKFVLKFTDQLFATTSSKFLLTPPREPTPLRNPAKVFQREKEFHLATTAQLSRMQKSIQRGTLKADEMFRKLKLTIEGRDDAA
uniref:Integrase catalytic domain-containing protein n=1 Tax=Tanacetum cinerariifolium TaxID=118510 RepID=A0A699GYB2_TANCI|nr:hypothetical protein [Tanacetum cinerariifolium]